MWLRGGWVGGGLAALGQAVLAEGVEVGGEDLVVRGRSSAAIGELLHLSPKTVDTYRSRIMTKLEVPDVPALVRLAIREGLISADED